MVNTILISKNIEWDEMLFWDSISIVYSLVSDIQADYIYSKKI